MVDFGGLAGTFLKKIFGSKHERDIRTLMPFVEEINEIYLKGVRFHYVDNIMEVLDFALLKEKVKDPRKFE